MEIITVKLDKNGGYIVNDTIGIPNDEGNRHYKMVQDWIAEGNTPEPAQTMIEMQIEMLGSLKAFATAAIERTIQSEIDFYNSENGIALSSVHNAESYSRVPSYTHKDFCAAVWIWSVELWEFMREWQGTLQGLPTEDEILSKIAEKPFVI